MKNSDWGILKVLHDTSSITKAATKLYLSQPFLTKRIQSIEEEFEVKIVKRTNTGVIFTKEGELLAEKASAYLKFYDELRQRLTAMKPSKQTIIKIGSSYTFSQSVLPDILVQYNQLNSQTQFKVVNEPSDQLFKKALNREVDVAFIRGDYTGNIVQKKISESNCFLVSRQAVSMSTIEKMIFIDYKMSRQTRQIINNWFEGHFQRKLPIGITAGYIDSAQQLVAKGVGFTCCFLPEDFKNNSHLVLTPMEDTKGRKIKRNTWFVYQPNKNEEINSFIDYINKQVINEK